MRIPLAAPLESRDGGVTKDAKVLNGIIEAQGEKLILRKRPGNTDLGLIRVGTAQLLTYWNGEVRTVIGDYLGAQQPNPEEYTNDTTWDPANKGINVALSNGNLTATVSAGGNAVFSLTTISSGQWYWETTIAGRACVGMSQLATGTSNGNGFMGVGFSNLEVGYQTADDAFNGFTSGIYKNNVKIIAATTSTTGDIIGVLYDKDAGTVAFYKNGTLLGTASGANLPAGTLYAKIGGTSNGGGGGTTNFGATPFTYNPTGTSNNLSPSTAGLPFSAQDNGSNAAESLLMIKNATQAWTIDTSGTVTQITDPDYPGTYSVTLTSLTRSGTVATATTAGETNFQVGSSVVIAGATPSDYNGTKTITGVSRGGETIPPPPAVAVTITRSGTTATATSTAGPHGFVNGQTVTIAGANQAQYNGAKTITLLTATTFSFTVTETVAAPTSPATGSPVIQPRTQSGSLGQYSSNPEAFQWNTGVTGGTSGFAIGDSITIFDGRGAGSANGTYTITDIRSSDSIARFTISGFTGLYSPSYVTVSFPSVTISSITYDGSVDSDGGTRATVTTSAPHKYAVAGTRLTISGATESQYNGNGFGSAVVVTSSTTFKYRIAAVAAAPATPATGTITAQAQATITGNSFTFTIAGSPATPATGTITATGGRSTVPGIVYIDGYFLVMDVFGVVYSSAEDDPTTWNALEFLTAQAETGGGVAIIKSGSYVACLKEWSTELLWNASNPPPGSPFSPVDNGFTQVGCASGGSIAKVGGLIAFMSQTREAGKTTRGVHLMDGLQQSKISTEDVDRILGADDLATVHAYGASEHGHSLYVLTLVTSNITLVYDLTSKTWVQRSSLTLGSSKSVSSITRSGTVATVTCSVDHTLSDGDPVLISGASQSDYNGIKQVTYVSATVFTFEVENSPATPATGTILAYPYTETYFKFTKRTKAGGQDLMLHESDGHLYEVVSTEYQDNGLPINVFTRSIRLDGGTSKLKKSGAMTFVGDRVSDYIVARFSDDDSNSFTTYRRFEVLTLPEPRLRRNGAFKRRTIETRFIGDNPLRAEAMEMEIL